MNENVYIIVGLGNIGGKYDNTRHNVGFDVINLLAKKLQIDVTKLKFKAYIGEMIINNNKIVLVKPQTYMNLSGESVREVINWYKTPYNKLMVIYDDKDIPFGMVRIKPKGSAGSHNGMKSVIYQIQSDEFPRVRIGIGAPKEGYKLSDYVLSKFSKDEQKVIDEAVLNAAESVICFIEHGIDETMNKFNCK